MITNFFEGALIRWALSQPECWGIHVRVIAEDSTYTVDRTTLLNIVETLAIIRSNCETVEYLQWKEHRLV